MFLITGNTYYLLVDGLGSTDEGSFTISYAGAFDDDGDDVPGAADNCPTVFNPDQADSDGDGIGDACTDLDTDGDGVADAIDNCPTDANADQADGDDDDVGDVCDNCPFAVNLDQADADGDGIGDACEAGRIGVRVIDGVGEFYNRETGNKFTPLGANYIRFGLDAPVCEQPFPCHQVFDPGVYSPCEVDTALRRMHADGYNTVRVWINNNCVGNPFGEGLWTEYLSNLADFLRRAQASEVFVLLVAQDLPYDGYWDFLPWDRNNIFGINTYYLTAESVEVTKRYWADLIQGLKDQNAPLSAILGYELENEQFYHGGSPPLSLNEGLVATGNGKTYDMAVPGDKQRMMDENLVFFIDEVRAAILAVDPEALEAIPEPV